MTELTEPDDSAAQPSPEWPPPGSAAVTDPLVARALARLDLLPQIPVTGHETAYNELHDELLAALDSDPAEPHQARADPAKGGA